MIKPIGDRVLIKPNYAESIGGIHLPETLKRSSIRRVKGTVLSVPESLVGELSVYDTVVFDDYGEHIEHDGNKYSLVDPSYIHVVLEE